MNSLPPHSAQTSAATAILPEESEGLGLRDFLDLLLDQRWLVGGVAAAGLFIAGAQAYLSTPIYATNSLVQVEKAAGNPLEGALGQAGALFDNGASIAAEMEILRSRMIVGRVVEQLQLDLDIRPRYAPVVGQWLSRRASEPSEPGFMGMSGYVTGNESVKIARFEVSPPLLGQTFVLAVTSEGIALRSGDGPNIVSGAVGDTLAFNHQGASGTLLVSSVNARPGAEFLVTRGSPLSVTRGLQGALRISEQGRSSGVINISLEGEDPRRIARIINEIAAQYVRQNIERTAAEAEKSLAFLDTQLPVLRRQLEASEDRLSSFRNEKGSFDLAAEASSLLGQMVELRTQAWELQQKRKELEERYTSEHPAMVAVDNQLRAVKAEIALLERSAKSLPATEQDLLRLTRDVKVNSTLYTNLLDSFQQLRLVKEGKVGNVRVIDQAFVPEYPVKPQRSRIVGIGLLLGLLAGIGLALLRNALRSEIRSPEEIEQGTGMSVLATVPLSTQQLALSQIMSRQKGGLHLLAHSHSTDVAVEGLRSLRTALQFAMLEADNKLVLLTGPAPSIGKSFVSANFAAVLAAAGKRVLLIDADLRKGHLHRYFGKERGPGLSELVAGQHPPEHVLHTAVVPGLDFIATGQLPPNPAELLGSERTRHVLAQLCEQYDIVIVDSAPVLPVSDSHVLATQAGTVLLVARAEQSSIGDLVESAKRLQQAGAQVSGVIFNGLDLSRRRYGYGYSNGYRYGRYRYRQDNYGSYQQPQS